MICPRCTDATLQAVIRDGVEIEVCPRCHGIWLDRGELTRLMAVDPIRASAAPIPADQYDPTAFGDEGRDHREPTGKKEKHRSAKSPDRISKKAKSGGKRSGTRKPSSWSRRLGEIIEDVIDELD